MAWKRKKGLLGEVRLLKYVGVGVEGKVAIAVEEKGSLSRGFKCAGKVDSYNNAAQLQITFYFELSAK